ncbi:hypothetical protein BurJ1DRAFT_1249 [Burkholderiales bacterium JOSHI_001]|nr:hypothetical protein BurJ1DRAFT_1249 [Burkholderiales bacterium JOSHI_001]
MIRSKPTTIQAALPGACAVRAGGFGMQHRHLAP